MSQSIKLDDDLYWDTSALHAEIVTAEWTASSSSASLTNVTETATLSPGKWLAICVVPTTDNDNMSYTLRSPTGSTDLGTSNYARGGSYTTFIRVVTVATTATVVLRTSASSTVNFTYTERGGCTYIKLAG